MTAPLDLATIRRLAEAARDAAEKEERLYPGRKAWLTVEQAVRDAWSEAADASVEARTAFKEHVTPARVLALVAEVESLRARVERLEGTPQKPRMLLDLDEVNMLIAVVDAVHPLRLGHHGCTLCEVLQRLMPSNPVWDPARAALERPAAPAGEG